jgi:hypothetical protein
MVMHVLADGVQPMSLIVRAWRRLCLLPGLPEAHIRCWFCMSLPMALSPLLLAADDGVFVATANASKRTEVRMRRRKGRTL